MASTFNTKTCERRTKRESTCSASRLFLHRDRRYFVSSIAQQLVRANKSPRWEIAVKIRLIHVIEGVVETQICAVDLYVDDIVHCHPGRLHGLLDFVHYQLRFFLRAGWRLACLHIQSDMTGNVECAADENSIAEGQRLCIRGTGIVDVLPVSRIGCHTDHKEQHCRDDLA